MALNKKRPYEMIDYDIIDQNIDTCDIFSDGFDELCDELFDKTIDDIFTNIFDDSKCIVQCSNNKIEEDLEIKKCHRCKKILDDDYNCKRCVECINKYKPNRKCTKCKIILDKNYYFKKCSKCLEKQRLYRIRTHNLKKCKDCTRTVSLNSPTNKCFNCIKDSNLIKCNKCYNILEPDYKFKVCVECRDKMKKFKQKLINNKQCTTCKIKLEYNYKFKSCDKCLKQKNKLKHLRH
jgi:hypothetical protein